MTKIFKVTPGRTFIKKILHLRFAYGLKMLNY